MTQTTRRPWDAVGPAQRGQTELLLRGRGDESLGVATGSSISGS